MNKKAFLLTALLAAQPAFASSDFKAWCDAYTAEGLVSLAANRIYGRISTLSDEQYKERSIWVAEASKLAAKRYKTITGKNYESFPANNPDWIGRCQLKSQIN